MSTIGCFATTVLNSNANNKVASDADTDLAAGEEAIQPESANEELPGSADNQISDGQNEAAEQLPVPQAASVSKTA